MSQQDLNSATVARLLKCSVRTVVYLFQDGAFPNAYKLNPSAKNSPLRIPKSDVENFLATRRLMVAAGPERR